MAHRTSIRLPRLTAAETSVLATALLTVAEAQAADQKKGILPGQLELVRQRLIKSNAALTAAQTPQKPAADPKAQVNAHGAVDNAWNALHDWLSGWAHLPGDQQNAANQLWELLFSKGTAFMKAAYKIEYQESDVRLNALTADDETLIGSLGGTPFLDHLREAHAAYGAALGITEVAEAPAKTTVKTELDACQAAIRDYLAKVIAYADPDLEGSEDLSAALCEPFDTWQTARRKKAAAPVNPTPPVPDPAPSPPDPTPAGAPKKTSKS
jgi:hypothetical protein